ncbi:MAG TPA: RNA-binding S4 domain-containing protein [Pelomicrobium sp.]|nr:RNA-binding S4 domain-containing protein [Pelomicrobium sp.]
MDQNDSDVRVDKWLWAARFFKTRSQAAEAVDSGRVEVNGAKVKPSRHLRVGDALRIRIGPYEWNVTVRALASRRGSAEVARTLYDESEESRARRADEVARVRAERSAFPDLRGRPTKKLRRDLVRFKRGRED